MGYSLKEEIELEKLDPDEYYKVKSFFNDFNTYASILNSILEKRSVGEIFTDNKSNPTFALVCSSSVNSNLNAPAYLGGTLNQISLKRIVSYLKTLPKISLVTFLNWEFKAFFEEEGFKPIERLQLRRPLDSFNLNALKQSLPSQYLIDKINSKNFAQCNWHSFLLSLYGDDEHFFANGMGFCICDQNKIAAESYAFIANNKAEIGVITDKDYRNQNLGTIISAIMLDYCYRNNIEPYWNCDIKNLGSAAIAKKLGFEEDCKYLFLRWLL